MKNNTRRKYTRPKPVQYYFAGCTIDLVRTNPDNRKWRVTNHAGDCIGEFPTIGSSIRGIRKNGSA